MLFCGTGMGVGIIANKFSGVYAATVENEAAARNSRAINNSNVLCMGGMVMSEVQAGPTGFYTLNMMFDRDIPVLTMKSVKSTLNASI